MNNTYTLQLNKLTFLTGNTANDMTSAVLGHHNREWSKLVHGLIGLLEYLKQHNINFTSLYTLPVGSVLWSTVSWGWTAFIQPTDGNEYNNWIALQNKQALKFGTSKKCDELRAAAGVRQVTSTKVLTKMSVKIGSSGSECIPYGPRKPRKPSTTDNTTTK